jgi:hypothetical protein
MIGEAGPYLVNRRQAAAHVALYRRTGHRSVRAKHAAIARKGLEPFAASFAVIEKLAGIRGHRLDGLVAAFRASQGGLKLHIGSCFALSIPQENLAWRESRREGLVSPAAPHPTR